MGKQKWPADILVESQLVNLRKNQSKLEQNQTANKGLAYIFPLSLAFCSAQPNKLLDI